jgi:hypothetical protein
MGLLVMVLPFHAGTDIDLAFASSAWEQVLRSGMRITVIRRIPLLFTASLSSPTTELSQKGTLLWLSRLTTSQQTLLWCTG